MFLISVKISHFEMHSRTITPSFLCNAFWPTSVASPWVSKADIGYHILSASVYLDGPKGVIVRYILGFQGFHVCFMESIEMTDSELVNHPNHYNTPILGDGVVRFVGYHLNRPVEPVFKAGPKPMWTEFGFHQRLESCGLECLRAVVVCNDHSCDLI